MPKETTRMMVLGIIASRGPVSGYGIEKVLEEWATARWASIAPASIYQQLRSLSSAGYIAATEPQSARASEFECTASGREALHELLLALLGDPAPQPLNLIPLLHFAPILSTQELVAGLTSRIVRIDAALSYESEVIERSEQSAPSHVTEIFRLTWEGLRADRAWCEAYLERLQRQI